MNPIAFAEVAWYRANGRYPQTRIVKDSLGQEYVIGDWSWSRGPYPPEIIEPYMIRIAKPLLDAALAAKEQT